jgi:hypothetical protein
VLLAQTNLGGLNDMDNMVPPKRTGRSILAIAAGVAVGIALTLVTDAVLHKAGFFPPLGQWTPSGPLAVATVYRCIYGILGAYIVARLAPQGPMGHALISGGLGVIASAAGAAATWNKNLGPHWYAIALIVTALPCAWIGGKLRLAQMRTVSAPVEGSN